MQDLSQSETKAGSNATMTRHCGFPFMPKPWHVIKQRAIFFSFNRKEKELSYFINITRLLDIKILINETSVIESSLI